MPVNFLSEIILITIAAFIGGFVARTIKLPPVLGYIVSGVLFGIIGKNFFESYDSLVKLSEFGVSLLLFTLGFEISLDTFKKMNKKIILVGFLQVILVATAITPALVFFGIDLKIAIIASILFSFSSTAVVVKLLEEKGLLSNFPGNNVFIFLLIQDLFIVPVIFLLPIIFSNDQLTLALVLDFLFSALKPFVIFVIILVLSRLFLSRLIHFLFRYPSHELTILATIFTASVSIFLLSAVGLPPALAAFLAGVLISEQGKNLTPLTEIRPFRDLFLVLFFVLTGMLLDFNFFIQNLPLILGITVAVIAIKFLIIYVLLRISRYSPSSSAFISTYLTNVGEFAIVIAQLAFLSLFITKGDYNLILSVFILSLIAIPLLVKYLRPTTERLARLGILGKILQEEKMTQEKSERKFENHVVICGHGRVGREVRSMLEIANISYVVIDFNRKIINELLALSKYAIYGDPTDVDILKASFIESAKALVVAVPDTFSQKKIIDLALKLNPKIVILCRSHIEEDRYDLINLGVNTIIMPELEAGLRIGAETLSVFNVKQEEIDSHVKRLRRQHLI